jgi:Cu2+-containing amine oxidase
MDVHLRVEGSNSNGHGEEIDKEGRMMKIIEILQKDAQNHQADGRKSCWCNYMHNILPNINYQPGFVIIRVDALYVSITDRFLCLFSIA